MNGSKVYASPSPSITFSDWTESMLCCQVQKKTWKDFAVTQIRIASAGGGGGVHISIIIIIVVMYQMYLS